MDGSEQLIVALARLPLVTREQLVETARSWAGTPTRHQGQLKGVSADCKGMVVGVCTELDLPEAKGWAALSRNYSKGFKGHELLQGLKETLVRVDQPLPGDVVAMICGGDPRPRHLGILTKPGWIIHAYFGARRVVEVPLDSDGQQNWRVHSYWTWPSLGAGHG